MSIYATYQPSPIWHDDAQLDVTGAIDVMHRNLALVDALLCEGPDALCAHAYANEPVNDNPHAYGQWGLPYRTGADTLTWRGRKATADTSCTMNLRFMANGVEVDDGITLTLSTDTELTWDLSTVVGLTLTDGEVLEIAIILYDDASPGGPPDGLGPGRAWGDLETTALFLSPLTPSRTWSTPPTFTGGPEWEKLRLLCYLTDYTAERAALAARPLFLALAHATGTFSDAESPMQIWRGGTERGAFETLNVAGALRVVNNPAEHMRLLVQGSEADVSSTAGPGDKLAFSFAYDISGEADDDPIRIELQDVREDTDGTRPSRIGLWRVWLSDGPTPLTLPALPAPESTDSWEDVKDYLNALADAVADLKTRLDANPHAWGRQHAYRQNYGFDSGEKAYFATRHVALGRRRGGRLLVRGRGVTIGWGAPTWTLVDDAEPDGPYNVQHAFSASLIGGTAWDAGTEGIETTLVYLDEVGVPPGVHYALLGEVLYAGELY